MNVLISAGEASGDLHGSLLLAALRYRCPDLVAFGMGGRRLTEAGLEPIVTSDSLGVVGIVEVLEKFATIRRALHALLQAAEQRRPSAAILIDFPDFHGWLARRLELAGIAVVYYVSPQVWAWRPGRARAIARRARRIVTLFRFEVDIYRRLGADAVWAGHPIVDHVRTGLAEPSPLAPKVRRRVVLLPGSRTAELKRHWEPMAAAAERLARRHDLELVAVRAAGLDARHFPRAAERGIQVVDGGIHPLLSSADLALVASGTATLEAALCGTPMIVVYRTAALSYAIGKALIHVRWISLVNILAGKEVVPELLQGQVNADRLEQEGESLLMSPGRLQRMRDGLAAVAQELGPPGASGRAAEAILEVLEPTTSRLAVPASDAAP